MLKEYGDKRANLEVGEDIRAGNRISVLLRKTISKLFRGRAIGTSRTDKFLQIGPLEAHKIYPSIRYSGNY